MKILHVFVTLFVLLCTWLVVFVSALKFLGMPQRDAACKAYCGKDTIVICSDYSLIKYEAVVSCVSDSGYDKTSILFYLNL